MKLQLSKNVILEAVFKDVVGYIIGFPPETISLMPKLFLTSKQKIFVDWELKNWVKIYYKELQNCLYINLPSLGKVLIPYSLVIDGKKIDCKISNFIYQIDSNIFKIPKSIKDLTENAYNNLIKLFKKNKKIYNFLNFRLKNLQYLDKEKKIKLTLQPVYYFDYLHTNLVLDAKYNNISLREYLHYNGHLEDLNQSPLANLVGLNFLVFTGSGKLLISKRSNKVAFRQGEYIPSVTGTLAYTDVPVQSHKFLTRELLEELGIEPNDIENFEFLGIARDLIRGGQPEMFFYIKTSLTENEIRQKITMAKDNYEIEDIFFFDFNKYGVLACDQRRKISKEDFTNLNYLVEKLFLNYKKVSVNLLAGLSLWLKTFH